MNIGLVHKTVDVFGAWISLTLLTAERHTLPAKQGAIRRRAISAEGPMRGLVEGRCGPRWRVLGSVQSPFLAKSLGISPCGASAPQKRQRSCGQVHMNIVVSAENDGGSTLFARIAVSCAFNCREGAKGAGCRLQAHKRYFARSQIAAGGSFCNTGPIGHADRCAPPSWSAPQRGPPRSRHGALVYIAFTAGPPLELQL